MLVGSLLATKLLDDKRHSNAFWARVGGVPLPELNALELRMMSMLDHRLLVTPEVLRRYIRQLQVCIAIQGGCRDDVAWLVAWLLRDALNHVGLQLNLCCKLHITNMILGFERCSKQRRLKAPGCSPHSTFTLNRRPARWCWGMNLPARRWAASAEAPGATPRVACLLDQSTARTAGATAAATAGTAPRSRALTAAWGLWAGCPAVTDPPEATLPAGDTTRWGTRPCQGGTRLQAVTRVEVGRYPWPTLGRLCRSGTLRQGVTLVGGAGSRPGGSRREGTRSAAASGSCPMAMALQSRSTQGSRIPVRPPSVQLA